MLHRLPPNYIGLVRGYEVLSGNSIHHTEITAVLAEHLQLSWNGKKLTATETVMFVLV